MAYQRKEVCFHPVQFTQILRLFQSPPLEVFLDRQTVSCEDQIGNQKRTNDVGRRNVKIKELKNKLKKQKGAATAVAAPLRQFAVIRS